MAIFDRFIRYEWAERALAMAVKQEHPEELQEWLIEQGLGNESASRTRHVLSHLWFDVNSSTNVLRTNALDLFSTVIATERLALHWGMAITQFPIFRETSRVIGRLGRLQNEFNKVEIVNRVLEKHSNQTTIRRAVARVIQTMVDWSVLSTVSTSVYQVARSYSIQSSVAEWLFRSLMIGFPEKYWLLPDLLGAAEFFPFNLAPHSVMLYQSAYLTVERDSFGAEVVGIRTL